MSRFPLALLATLLLALVGDHPMLAQDRQGVPCAVKNRLDPVAAGRAREAKRQRMRANRVPERYLHLLDRMECVKCIETAPDTLHITVLYNDDEHAPTLSTGERDLKVEFRWNPQSERQLRDELRAGEIRAFYVWIHERRCNCCPDLNTKAESYADWNEDLELNMDEAQQYDDPDDLGPLPDDLKPPPPGSQAPPPPVERFDDLPRPSRRVLQATCRPCEALAQQWTNESNNLNFLWDRKLERMRQISVVTNIIANRRNEIANLEYQQRFDSTRTHEQLQKIRELKKLNEDHESQVEEYERDLADIEQKVDETELRMEELMQQFLECEKSCRQTTTATPTGAIRTDPAPVNAGNPALTNAGNPPPVTTKPEPDPAAQPSGAPGATAPAMCPDCDAAAAEVARLNAQIGERTAELNRLRALEAGNSANIANLTQLRADAAGQANAAERVAELERRIADLQAANTELRARQFGVQQEITGLSEAVAKALRALDDCNSRCAAATNLTGAGFTTGTGTPKRTVVVNPLPPMVVCKECESVAAQLRAAHQELQRLAQRANDLQMESEFAAFEEQRVRVAQLEEALKDCIKTKCGPTTTAAACSGAECSDEWNACTAANSCTPIDRDCGVPGTCSAASSDMSHYNLQDPSGWLSAANADSEPRVQIKIGEAFDDIVVGPLQRAQIGSWFNPLGLLARRVVDNIERWRGSVGPRPLINPRDLHAIEPYSSAQSVGLPKGVHVLLTDRGGSTGRTLGVQILNLTGQPLRLRAMPFAIEPIKQQTQARVQQAFSRLVKAAPVNVDLAGYCVEFLKLPPAANQIFRLAPASVQKQYESMSKVLRSAYRIQHAGLLRPDSNPAAYTDAIKQWALWVVEQKFNEARFTDAFLGHTRKNVEAAGQPWSKPAEEMLRKISPNRWRDIVKVLSGAGVAVPQ